MFPDFEYTVVPRGHIALLGAQTVQQFSLITVNTDNIMSVSDTAAAQTTVGLACHSEFRQLQRNSREG